MKHDDDNRTSSRDFAEELAVATALAQAAGDAILRVRAAARAGAVQKPDGKGPVTEADLAADDAIRSGLTEAFPHDAVVTEETWEGGDVGAHARIWMIDPVDGTEDFVAGRADYVVQIGLCVGGAPLLGVAHAPRPATRGVASWAAVPRRTIQVASGARARSPRGALGAPRVAVSVTHPSAIVEVIVLDSAAGRAKGSVGLKVGLMVDDDADAYLSASRRIKVWDTCAPAAVGMPQAAIVVARRQRIVVRGPAPHHAGVAMWTPAGGRSSSDAYASARDRLRHGRSAHENVLLPRLGVNVDHVATVRQARHATYPDPVHAAVLAELGGAAQITVHLREDRRHIQDRDLESLRKTRRRRVQPRDGGDAEMVRVAFDAKPDIVTLVPERRQEVTTEGGLDVNGHRTSSSAPSASSRAPRST